MDAPTLPSDPSQAESDEDESSTVTADSLVFRAILEQLAPALEYRTTETEAHGVTDDIFDLLINTPDWPEQMRINLVGEHLIIKRPCFPTSVPSRLLGNLSGIYRSIVCRPLEGKPILVGGAADVRLHNGVKIPASSHYDPSPPGDYSAGFQRFISTFPTLCWELAYTDPRTDASRKLDQECARWVGASRCNVQLCIGIDLNGGNAFPTSIQDITVSMWTLVSCKPVLLQRDEQGGPSSILDTLVRMDGKDDSDPSAGPAYEYEYSMQHPDPKRPEETWVFRVERTAVKIYSTDENLPPDIESGALEILYHHIYRDHRPGQIPSADQDQVYMRIPYALIVHAIKEEHLHHMRVEDVRTGRLRPSKSYLEEHYQRLREHFNLSAFPMLSICYLCYLKS